ncbi:hypothetical protein LV779_34550 [Streptomyces thinghirensis]|nr:hypothetical protein [Streptomyces thinghirensis]
MDRRGVRRGRGGRRRAGGPRRRDPRRPLLGGPVMLAAERLPGRPGPRPDRRGHAAQLRAQGAVGRAARPVRAQVQRAAGPGAGAVPRRRARRPRRPGRAHPRGAGATVVDGAFREMLQLPPGRAQARRRTAHTDQLDVLDADEPDRWRIGTASRWNWSDGVGHFVMLEAPPRSTRSCAAVLSSWRRMSPQAGTAAGEAGAPGGRTDS